MQGTGDRVRVVRHSQSDSAAAAGVTSYLEIQLPTKEGISLHDITPQLRQARFYASAFWGTPPHPRFLGLGVGVWVMYTNIR